MSQPTVYEIKDHEGNTLTKARGSIWSWSPTSRERSRELFDREVGEIIVSKLAVHRAGGMSQPSGPGFTLADIGSIESAGGRVPADELPGCVRAYVRQQEAVVDYLWAEPVQDNTLRYVFEVNAAIANARVVEEKLEALSSAPAAVRATPARK